MALRDLSSHAAVHQAMREYDNEGRDTFLKKHGFKGARRYFVVHGDGRYDSKALAAVAHGYQFPDLGVLKASEFSGGDVTVVLRLRALGFEVVDTQPVPAVRTLEFHQDYSRHEVHRIFEPSGEYHRGAGTWGGLGIVEASAGDFVFFVTFGRTQGTHTFDEGISHDGVLTWQSQPRQRREDPQIRQLIAHDVYRNNIWLFLRTTKRAANAPMPYTYLGRLGYITHDVEREQPCHFQWQLLDGWPLSAELTARTGLILTGTPPAPLPPAIAMLRVALTETPTPAPTATRGTSTAEFIAKKVPDRALQDARNRDLGLLGERAVVGLIRSRGHLSKGGYDVSDAREHRPAAPPAVRRRLQSPGHSPGPRRGQVGRRGGPRSRPDRVGPAAVGGARPGRPHRWPHRSDQRRAGGARHVAQGESRAADGARDLKKSGGLLREAPGVRFAWIATEKATYPLRVLCRALRVTSSGFYAWQQRPLSAHARRDAELDVRIRALFTKTRQRYGSPRIHDDLREAGVPVSRKRIARLMRQAGLRARQRKRYRSTTMSEHDQPIAPNHLAQTFVAEAPNQRWVSDTTEFSIGSSGKLYLATILDLYSRFVVGWAVSAVNDRHLTLKALDQALRRRGPAPGLLHHSDQGCTYASADYQRVLEARGLVCSMSRRGNCHDNAVAESFFSTVKSELADRFDSFGEAKMELFDYIEVFYNQQRRHSTIGRISPAAFERRFSAQAA